MKENFKNGMERRLHEREWTLHLDGIAYGAVDVEKITPGYCEVDVHVDDHGENYECMMVSGHVAVRVESESLDAIRPHPAWFMFVKKELPPRPAPADETISAILKLMQSK